MNVAGTIRSWWDGVRRDLPWRHTRDPWAVMVSELMLQQTQVARVIPKYEAFLTRFPTVHDCASAPVGAVIAQWDGLGYNRRAVHLHRAAVAVDQIHGGVFPNELDELLALPGIGPYTARAVLAFAFEQDVAVLDTNVARVVARLENRRLNAREAQSAADALVLEGDGWAWNQAILDFGATICQKRSPRCAECPVQSACAWQGANGSDPADGSAGVTGRQSRFEGSHRQGRGRLVAAVRKGPVRWHDLATVCGWPDDEARSRLAADQLIAEGILAADGDYVVLP